MAGSLLAAPVFRAVDDGGLPLPGALLKFYLTGTTTPAPVYTTPTLTTPLSNPVVADSGGLFTPIYLDPSVTYRCQLLTSVGSLIEDVDPATAGVVEATPTQVNAGTATGVYVSPAGLAGWTGVATALGFTPLNKAGDTATNLLLANPAPAANSAGYLGAPVNEQDASYTFALTDAGGMVRTTSASASTYTIQPASAVGWPVGTTIVVRNAGAGTVTITRGTGVILMVAGSNANEDVALGPYGLATCVRDAGNDSWVISGTPLS